MTEKSDISFNGSGYEDKSTSSSAPTAVFVQWSSKDPSRCFPRPDFEGNLVSPDIPSNIIARIPSDAKMPKIALRWMWTEPGLQIVSVGHSASIVYDDHGRADHSRILHLQHNSLAVEFDFGSGPQGGTFSATSVVHWRRIKDGVMGESPLGSYRASIRADNPTKSIIRASLHALHLQVICYMESRFCQFDNSGLPLFGPPHGFGSMQLDKPPATARQVWDWKENVSAGIALHQKKVTEVRQHFKNIYSMHPNAKKLTDEEISLAVYQYYNGGYYWEWNDKVGKWRKGALTAYADAAQKIEQSVLKGRPPIDWT